MPSVREISGVTCINIKFAHTHVRMHEKEGECAIHDVGSWKNTR